MRGYKGENIIARSAPPFVRVTNYYWLNCESAMSYYCLTHIFCRKIIVDAEELAHFGINRKCLSILVINGT